MPRWSESFYLAAVCQVADAIARFRFSLDDALRYNTMCNFGFWLQVDGKREFLGNFVIPVEVVKEAYDLATLHVGL